MAKIERSFVDVGPSSRVGVGVESYNGEKRFDVRLFWKKDGRWLATQKGVFMPIEMMDEFMRAVEEARDNYRSRTVEEESE